MPKQPKPQSNTPSVECNRCGGSGQYGSYGTCYACRGRGWLVEAKASEYLAAYGNPTPPPPRHDVPVEERPADLFKLADDGQTLLVATHRGRRIAICADRGRYRERIKSVPATPEAWQALIDAGWEPAPDK